MQAEVRPSTQSTDLDRTHVASLLADVAAAMRANPVDFARIDELTELLAQPPAQGADMASRIGALVDITWFHNYSSLTPRNGMIAANHAVELAEKLGDASILRRALTIKGVVCNATSDTGMAMECHCEALRLLANLNDAQAEWSVWINLGADFISAALYQNAIQCFERAVEVATLNPMPNLPYAKHDAWSNIGLCFLHMENFPAGIKAMQKAVEGLQEPASPAEFGNRALSEYTHTRLLLSLGQPIEAKLHALLAKSFAEKAKRPGATLAADNAEGLVEVFSGSVDIGITRLTVSLERSKTLKAGYRDTLVALVMAHERANNMEKAVEYQGALMTNTSRAFSENVLFHNKLHLAKLSYVEHQEHQISVVQDRHFEVLRRKSVEKVRLSERVEMLERLAVTAELRDDSTGEHSYRVGRLAMLLAKAAGCDEDLCAHMDLAGRLHDVGKIGVPDSILLKPGPLLPAERALMETHTTVGAELLSKSDMPELQFAEIIARYHHEWWNGEGYPFKLKGEKIPLPARIAAIADVFDALTHQRVYKHAWTDQDAINEIHDKRGTQFDPQLVDLFIPMIHRLRKEHGDLDGFLGQAAKDSSYQLSRAYIAQALGRDRPLSSLPPAPSSQ